jgi:hypothetical protein
MNKRIFEAFDARKEQVEEYMAGCAMKYGMACTCGPGCRCKNCPIHPNGASSNMVNVPQRQEAHPSPLMASVGRLNPANQLGQGLDMFQPSTLTVLDEEPLHVDQPMNFFGVAPPPGTSNNTNLLSPTAAAGNASTGSSDIDSSMRLSFYGQDSGLTSYASNNAYNPMGGGRSSYRSAQRNPSVISYGNGLRHMSFTSETTFGRAMSGLSALSIDWENLEDFDLEVDHSAHINNLNSSSKSDVFSKRTSLRRSGASDSSEAHVSFKV